MKMIKSNAHKLYSRSMARALTLGVALSPALAFAQAAAPDTSEIKDQFVLYGAAATTLVIALCVVLWAIRGASLLKPKG